MSDNPTFILDEQPAKSNGLALVSSDEIDKDFHDPGFSLNVSPAVPRKARVDDPSSTRSEVVSIRSLGSGQVVIQITHAGPPQSKSPAVLDPQPPPLGQSEAQSGLDVGEADPCFSTNTKTHGSSSTHTKEEGNSKGKEEEGDKRRNSYGRKDGDGATWYGDGDQVQKSAQRTTDPSDVTASKTRDLGTGLQSPTTVEENKIDHEDDSDEEEEEEESEDYDYDHDDDDQDDDHDHDYDDQDDESNPANMLYRINDNPPWYLAMGLGFQHYLTMVGSTITIPFILTPELCIQHDDPARGFILSTIFFISGIVTFLQASFGVRLPIVQGGSFAFFAPTLAILHTGFPSCDTLDVGDLTMDQRQEEWQSRMREVQGSIVAAALLEMVIGFSGLIGLVVSLITPLAITPTVCLVGLALFDVAATKAATHWGISGLTIMLMILFSQYLRKVMVPIPVFRARKGFSVIYANIFGLFPVLLSILLSWALCAILTAADALPEGSKARTDTAGQLIANSPWIRVPYPGQWGWPTVSAAGVLGILAALIASIVESVGDYYACARLSGAPPPPRHAINRGIGFEGFGCLLAGLWGTGNGTTSYSENIGAIGITKVGSRRVIQYGAGVMIVFGVLGKFAAVFVTIPEPVVGGIFCVMFAMITAVGLSSLQHVDLNSSRNLFVLGFPIFFGLALPKWLENNPGILLSEKYPGLTQIATVLLKTSMFVGGLLGIILDNTIPGTDKERGLHHRHHQMQASDNPNRTQTDVCEEIAGVYDFPVGMAFIKRFKWLTKVPFSPTFRGWNLKKKV